VRRPAEEGSPLSLRLAGRKRQLSDPPADEPQPVSSKLKSSEAPTVDPPSFPTKVEEFVKISEHGGSTAYLSFSADYSTIRLAVVFASLKQKEISSSEEELMCTRMRREVAYRSYFPLSIRHLCMI